MWGNQGRHSQVETKTPTSINLLPCLIYLKEANETGHQTRFELESFVIVVDNHALKVISNQRSQFISNFFPLPHQHIKWIIGQISIKGQGTIMWKIEYYEVRVYILDIKDALYLPESLLYVLRPQHRSHQANKKFPTQRGTYMANFEENCVLYWNQRRNNRSIRWDPKTNTGGL